MTPSSPSPVPGPAAGPEALRELLYERALDWLADDPDPRTRSELADLIEAADDDQLADRFSCLVPFGTAGLRAELGAGPNRMNLAVVIRAAAAVAGWVHRREGRASHGGQPSVVVGFDARHRSQEFAVAAAEVLAGAGVRALLLPGPVPTPLTAFAVTHLGADAALMVTASHNPSGDNGLKVFDASGRQIVSPQDREIADDMTAIARVSSVPRTGPDDPDIVHLDATVQQAYLAAAAMMVKTDGPRDLVVAYTPLHGVAGDLFGRLVESAGFSPVAVVADQAAPDPDFPTVAFPNPEEPGTLERALTLAERCGADILLAHDPDGDRLGVAIPDDGWRVLTGDEIGVLIARHLLAVGQMRDGAVMASSVVSSRLLAAVAAAAGVEHVTTLTGFKWISRASRSRSVPGLRLRGGPGVLRSRSDGRQGRPDRGSDADGVRRRPPRPRAVVGRRSRRPSRGPRPAPERAALGEAVGSPGPPTPGLDDADVAPVTSPNHRGPTGDGGG